MDHVCKYFVRGKDQYIPDYRQSEVTGGSCYPVIEVPEYECIQCGKKMGWIPVGAKIVERPKWMAQD